MMDSHEHPKRDNAMTAHKADLSAKAAEAAVDDNPEKSCIVLVFDETSRSLCIRPGSAPLLPIVKFDETMADVLIEAAQELRSGHVHDPSWHQFVKTE